MSGLRVFALCAVVAGGAAAMKGLGAADHVTALVLGAPAVAAPDTEAESSAPPPAAAPEPEPGPEDAAPLDMLAGVETSAPPADGSTDAPPPAETAANAAACPPSSLMERSGLSHAELRVLGSLSERRAAIDAREVELRNQGVLLEAAETRIEARVEELKSLREDVERLLGQLDEAEQQQVDSLVSLYAAMKPKDAARILPGLDADVRLAVAAQMDERALSGILAAMADEDAIDLTMLLARRHDTPDTLEDRLAR